MFFDFQNTESVGDILVFPDWPFSAPPKEFVKETIILTGSNTGGSVSIQGSADDIE